VVSLAEARQRARAQHQLLLDGLDPLAKKRNGKVAAALEAAKAITFATCAGKYVSANRAGWRNSKHAEQWTATLATYVYPLIGTLPVAAIDTTLVTKILEPTGRQSLRPPRGRAEGSRRFLIMRRCISGARGRILRGGGGIWRTSCRSDRGFAR
jgi:hypothetical protein